MRIALLQLNPTVGDLTGNIAGILDALSRVEDSSCDLAVTPELAVCGYPPRDLLLREGFIDACDAAVDDIARRMPAKIALLIGHPTRRSVPGGRAANAVSLLVDGKVCETRHKFLLPNYDVFDERRYFRPADRIEPIEFGGRLLGVHICEDAWFGAPQTSYHLEPSRKIDPVAALVDQGADLLINLSASPFESSKWDRRCGLLSRHARTHECPMVFVNQVGGNDDLVFDGYSLVLDSSGQLVSQLEGFRSDISVVDLSDPGVHTSVDRSNRSREAELFDALVLGLGDYVRKSGFSDCVLGLSGGIDSALACCIAADAVGPDHVHALMMPSRYSSEHSLVDSRQLVSELGIHAHEIPINAIHSIYEQMDLIGDELRGTAGSLADQNLQARIRGTLVMIRSNRNGWLAIATGNKSELAVGYCTLYGDMAGGFAVLSDVFKRDVYAMARLVNDRAGREVVPRQILEKAPSAELAPGQFDSDSLPPYPTLDAILEGLVEREESVATLCRKFDPETVSWVAGRLDRNEFKRRQMPPGIKLSARAFGSGRRMPMAARFESAPFIGED